MYYFLIVIGILIAWFALQKKWRSLGWVLVFWGVWTGIWTLVPTILHFGESEWTFYIWTGFLQSAVCLAVGIILVRKFGTSTQEEVG